MDGIDAGSVAIAGAAVAALVISILSYLGSAAEKVYFEYTNRYREVLLDLPSGFFSDKVSLASTREVQDTERIPKVVQSYVDLCSEEVKLRLRRKVWGKVWRDWSDGIVEGLKCKNVRTVLAENHETSDYRVLVTYVNLAGKDGGKAAVKAGVKAARMEYKHPPKVTCEPLTLGVDAMKRPGP